MDLFANHLHGRGGPVTRPVGQEGVESADELRQALGILQHHDAVTGTEKQEVANDYSQTLSTASEVCKNLISDALFKLVPDLTEVTDSKGFLFCDLLNISVCRATDEWKPYLDHDGNGGVYIVLYNPHGWESWSTWVRVPLYLQDNSLERSNIVLQDLRFSQSLPYQLVPISPRTREIPEYQFEYTMANTELVFNAAAAGPPGPPTGTVTFYLAVGNRSTRWYPTTPKPPQSECKQLPKYSQATRLRLEVNPQDKINPVSIVAEHVYTGTILRLSVEMKYYIGESHMYRNSGAYVFRPATGTGVKSFTAVTYQASHYNWH